MRRPRQPRHRVGLGWVALIIGALALGGALLGLRGDDSKPAVPTVTTVAATTTARCAPPSVYLARGKPSPCLTPGVVRTSDPKVICVAGYATRVRSELDSGQWTARRAEVARRYGLVTLKGRTVDHQLPLEGGGSNDIANLVPQEQTAAKGKDIAERGLHAGICKPGVTVEQARRLQDAFLNQWR